MRVLILFSLFFLSCQQEKESHTWTFTRELEQKPRGGSTKGKEVTFQKKPSKEWLKLQELKKKKTSTKLQLDRHAILALSGVYKTQFEFLETFNIAPHKELDVPYQSWGTEWVFVLENKEDFISLQHLMVMYMVDPKSNEVKGPMVMKHWRQDWQWRAKEQFVYMGQSRWQKKKLPQKDQWLWSIYQVDDSPRYEGIGSWKHFQNTSIFETEDLARPLPRRERSMRDDYHVLLGKDTLVLTPTAWYHEQKNLKHQGNLSKNFERTGTILTRELGHNSYQALKDFDYSAGKEYWDRSKNYWKNVRTVWDKIRSEKKSFTLKKKVGKNFLFMEHFSHAEDPEILKLGDKEQRKLILKTLKKYLQ